METRLEAVVPRLGDLDEAQLAALAKSLELPAGTYPLAYEARKAYGHSPLLGAFEGRLRSGLATGFGVFEYQHV